MEGRTNYGRLAAWTLALCCATAAQAQTAVDLHPPGPRLPGDGQARHFSMEPAFKPARSPLAANLGQSVARFVAHQHKMGGRTVVQYGSPDRSCKFERDDPSCP